MPAGVVPLASRPVSRPLTFWMAVALVMGNMIGSGIFLLPSSLARFGADGHEWAIEDLESSLELMLELQACSPPVTAESMSSS